MALHDIVRRAHITRDELASNYLSPPGTPVVLTDMIDCWPARTRWTFDYLATSLDNRAVIASDELFQPKARYRMPLRMFGRYCEMPAAFADRIHSSRPLYVAVQPFTLDSPLWRDLEWPGVIDNLYSRLGPEFHDWYLRHFGVILIGPAGTVTPLHEDLFGTHAWLAQLVGRKRFTFSVPGPAGADAPPVLETVLNPGDMIVFPQGWRHQVTALDPSISVSFNFVNETNVRAHVREICRDLPGWARRVNSPPLIEALRLTWRIRHLQPEQRGTRHA